MFGSAIIFVAINIKTKKYCSTKQSIIINNESIVINLPIKKHYGVNIKTEKEMCDLKDEKGYLQSLLKVDNSKSETINCDNNVCEISIELSDGYKDIKNAKFNYKKSNGTCAWENITSEAEIISYSVLLEINDELKEKLMIKSEKNPIFTTMYNDSVFIYNVDGVKKARFSYEDNIKSDFLMLNGNIVAKLNILKD